MKRVNQKITIKDLCMLAEVNESGYYKWLKNAQLRDIRLKNELRDFLLIKEIFEKKRNC